MATDSGYSKRDYLRICDVCGHRFHFSDLKPIGEMKFACPDDYPGLTALQISRYNARVRPVIIRPNKYAKDYSQTPIYQLPEAQIFNFIASVSPKGNQDGTDDPLAAAWATIYMADVVNQNLRPLTWNRTALETISRSLTYLLTQQYGAPTGISPSATVDNPRYGGILSGANYSTQITIAAGSAFVKAYQATGTTDYLLAADRCATFLRHVQCGDLQASAYVVFPSGGGQYHSGGLAEGVVSATGLLQTTYRTADIAALWFLSLLGAVRGSGTYYGDAAATAFFTAPTRATIATMSSELTTFAESGVRDSMSSELVPGLSTAAPRATYQAAVNGTSGGATWASIDTVPSDDIVLALLGLYTANGNDAKVQEMIAWLQAFTSNVNNRTPAVISDEALLNGITGTYDPTLCPADNLMAAAPFTEADDALYSWASLGILSPILNAVALRTSKDTLSRSVPYTTLDPTFKYLGPIGSSGLSLQPFYRGSTGGLVGAAGGIGSTPGGVTLPSTGLVLWTKGDYQLVDDGFGKMLTQGNAASPTFNPGYREKGGAGGEGPLIGVDTLDGIPGTTWPLDTAIAGDVLLEPADGSGAVHLKDRNGVNFGYGPGETQTITWLAVVIPRIGTDPFGDILGGTIFRLGNTAGGGQLDLDLIFRVETRDLPPLGTNTLVCFSNDYQTDYADAVYGPTTLIGTYADVPMLLHYESGGRSDNRLYITGPGIGTMVPVPLSPGTLPSVSGHTHPHSSYGTVDVVPSPRDRWMGARFEDAAWDHLLSPTEVTAAYSYFAARYPSMAVSFPVSNVVRAAKTGMIYRQDPGRYPALRGN